MLVSIIIGLAIAHILSAFGSAVHRLRGHGPPIRLEPVYLLWVGFLFIWLVSFWWWEFKFQDLDVEWSFGLYLFIVSYAMWLFVLAVVLVPDDMEGMRDSFEYFLEGRHWFFAALLITIGVDIADTFLKCTDWGLRPVFIAQTTVFGGRMHHRNVNHAPKRAPGGGDRRFRRPVGLHVPRDRHPGIVVSTTHDAGLI